MLLYALFTALADGALDPVLTMCAMKEAIALLALMTLSHIVEHQGNLAPLIEVSKFYVVKCFSFSNLNDDFFFHAYFL